MEISELQSMIYRKADEELGRSVGDAFRSAYNLLRETPTPLLFRRLGDLPANLIPHENHSVLYVIEQAVIEARKTQYRTEYIKRFLQRVEDYGVRSTS